MTNYFCSVCGTLMYRVSSGFPGKLIPRIGTIDDFNLQETVFKPRIGRSAVFSGLGASADEIAEQYVKDRVGWFGGSVGSEKHQGGYFK